MKKITEKQSLFLELIINYYKVNKILPTIKDLKEITNYKSYNTLYKYLNVLEKKDYIKYDSNRKQVVYINKSIKDDNVILLPFKNQDSNLNIINSNDFKVIKVHDNNLHSYGIYRDDSLVVSNDLSYLNNKFVCIRSEFDYKIYKHIKRDRFHYLINDKEELVYENTNIITFKVVSLIRNM